MPPVVATKCPTPVSIIAAPVAKGILIKTTIEASYHEDDTMTLRQHPTLIHKLRHKVNGLPYGAFVDDHTVRQRKPRMLPYFDLREYTDDKAI